MNIVRENIGKLNDVLTVKVEVNDYKDAVDKSLKELRRKAVVPGFRAGHVPMGMIERQYKSSVTVDEVSKLINSSVEDYLKENNINILFEPMALPEKTEGNFDKPENFSFSFEIGIRPEIKVNYTKANGVPFRKIVATEEQINTEVKNLRRRIGKFSSTEVVVDEDMVMGNLLSEEEGKEAVSSTLMTTYLKDSEKGKVVGKKLHDVLTLDTTKIFKSDYERSTFLKCKIDELEKAPVKVKFEINAIHHVEPAELNEEFFDRAFSQSDVKDEAGMRAHLKSQIEQGYAAQENMQYRGEAMQALMEGLDVELPDSFVKKYIIEKDPNYTAENIEEKYPDLQKSLAFQLMENTIAADGNVKIEYTDVVDYIHQYVSFNYLGMSYQALDPASKGQVDKMAESMLKQESTVNNVYENIYFERITDIIRDKASAKIQEVSMEEFLGSSSLTTPKASKSRTKKTASKKAEESEAVKDSKSAEEKTPKTATGKSAKTAESSAKKPAAKKSTAKNTKE